MEKNDLLRFVDSGVEEIEDQAIIDLLDNKVYFVDHGLDDIIKLMNELFGRVVKLETQLDIIKGAFCNCVEKGCPIEFDMLNTDRVAIVYPYEFINRLNKLENIYMANYKEWFDGDDLSDLEM